MRALSATAANMNEGSRARGPISEVLQTRESMQENSVKA